MYIITGPQEIKISKTVPKEPSNYWQISFLLYRVPIGYNRSFKKPKSETFARPIIFNDRN